MEIVKTIRTHVTAFLVVSMVMLFVPPWHFVARNGGEIPGAPVVYRPALEAAPICVRMSDGKFYVVRGSVLDWLLDRYQNAVSSNDQLRAYIDYELARLARQRGDFQSSPTEFVGSIDWARLSIQLLVTWIALSALFGWLDKKPEPAKVKEDGA